ncbi:uncharacterized protein TNCV_1598031 [Trichonephila clavipes]|nr:uncharacterized protein TNCV_1598031 [Trichonephila clavipes]
MNVSLFLIEKAISSSIGQVNSIRKMRFGDLFLEVSNSKQTTALIQLQKLAHLQITVTPLSNLNFSRGVILPAVLLNVSAEEILENMKAQKVCGVRRIMIRQEGQVLNTKHLILIFSTSDLQKSVKAAYISCSVRPYIPNPLRCFQYQRYGHSKIFCRDQPTYPRCGEIDHDSASCTTKERCVNCKEARRIVSLRTPVSKQFLQNTQEQKEPSSGTEHPKTPEETIQRNYPIKKSQPILEPDLMDLHPSDIDKALHRTFLPYPSTSSSERGI